MTNSIRDITEQSGCIFIIGSNTTEQHPVIGIKIRRAKRQRGAKLIVADPRQIDIATYADLHLRHTPGTDLALLNGLMHIIIREGWQDQKFVDERTEGFEALKEVVAKYTPEVVAEITGVPAEQLERAARMMAENRPGSLLYAMGITQHTVGVANVTTCANLQMLLGNMGVPGGGVNPLRGQNNVQGACDMGGLPNVYPGYQNVTDPASQARFEQAWGVSLSDKIGLTVTEMLHGLDTGAVRGLYVIGENPMTSDPDLNHVREAMTKSEFFVLQEIFYSETAQFADVIFPAASFVEKEGTFTNTERRIQRVRKAVPPPGEAQPDSWIVTEVATRMIALGASSPAPEAPWAGWRYAGPAAVMSGDQRSDAELRGRDVRAAERRATSSIGRCATPAIPAPLCCTPASSRRGLGRFVPSEHLPPAELPDDEYPLMLTTGRVLYHWHGAEMTRRARGLNEVYPEALIEVSPKDAQAAGVKDGDMITLASRRGEIMAKAQVTPARRRGAGVRHLPLPGLGSQLPDQPGAGPAGEDPGVQGVRGQAGQGGCGRLMLNC